MVFYYNSENRLRGIARWCDPHHSNRLGYCFTRMDLRLQKGWTGGISQMAITKSALVCSTEHPKDLSQFSSHRLRAKFREQREGGHSVHGCNTNKGQNLLLIRKLTESSIIRRPGSLCHCATHKAISTLTSYP